MLFDHEVTVHGFVPRKAIPVPGGRVLEMGEIALQHARLCDERAMRRIEACAREKGIALHAAADLLGPGVIEVPRYESEILDMVRGRGYLGQRVKALPATGQPTRYFEQRTIASGGFVDPRIIGPTAETPERAERYATIKAIAGQVNFSFFDSEVTRDQGLFNNLLAKDVMDLVKGMLRTSDKAAWRGSDTDLGVPTTKEYVGGQTQINRTFHVASTASVVDATKTEVASLTSNEAFEVRPTAIYGHPMALDLFDQEERQNHRQLSEVGITDKDGKVVSGVTVSALSTQAGKIPLIPDWSMPVPVASISESGKTDYSIAILTEELVERHFVGSEVPRLFVLGLLNNLATQYVGVVFDCFIFKGKADLAGATPETNVVSYAHSFGTVTR